MSFICIVVKAQEFLIVQRANLILIKMILQQQVSTLKPNKLDSVNKNFRVVISDTKHIFLLDSHQSLVIVFL